MRDHTGPFVPKIGDYAIVIHAGRAYPAIVGDSGPSHKVGEASLILCREISQRSSNLIRATSDLNAAYLVFPGSADESPAPPNLARWREKCGQLAAEAGRPDCATARVAGFGAALAHANALSNTNPSSHTGKRGK
jgi:hypothetical protein